MKRILVFSLKMENVVSNSIQTRASMLHKPTTGRYNRPVLDHASTFLEGSIVSDRCSRVGNVLSLTLEQQNLKENVPSNPHANESNLPTFTTGVIHRCTRYVFQQCLKHMLYIAAGSTPPIL